MSSSKICTLDQRLVKGVMILLNRVLKIWLLAVGECEDSVVTYQPFCACSHPPGHRIFSHDWLILGGPRDSALESKLCRTTCCIPDMLLLLISGVYPVRRSYITYISKCFTFSKNGHGHQASLMMTSWPSVILQLTISKQVLIMVHLMLFSFSPGQKQWWISQQGQWQVLSRCTHRTAWLA